ncbi:hypothetical protein IL306_001201 [Fusarium sp. DS 682]|nr:hypothetical protein IL306_001201 [Fusarium sp. DS 682]
MSGEIKTIARALRSASHMTLDNGDLLLLSNQGGRLVEKVYDGEELKDQRTAAAGVKEGTTAGYARSKDRVLVFYIASDGLIKGSEFDDDAEEWDDAELEGLGDVTVHAESHLTVADMPGANVVLYQSTDGSVEAIQYGHESDKWAVPYTIPGDALPGTPIAGFSTDKALIVSFIGNDKMIHAHIRDFETGDWTDHTLPESSFDEPVNNLIVAKDKDTGDFEAYVLVDATVHHVTKNNTRETVGSFSGDGDFVPATKAEAGGCYGNNWGNYGCGCYRRGCGPCW